MMVIDLWVEILYSAEPLFLQHTTVASREIETGK